MTRLLAALPSWGDYTGCLIDGTPTLKCIEATILRILGLVATLGLAVFLIIALIAGLRYITSQGDPKQVQKAQDSLKNAVLGLVLLVGAWLALKLVEVFTGVPITKNFTLTP